MSLSISSSDPWRAFFRLIAGTAAIMVGLVYLFVVLVDPFDTLPLSPPLNRAPVATNARFSFPALARSARFDSALFGTSTSRLLRPVAIDPLFGTRLANLAMNDATAYEMDRLMGVFLRAHQDAKFLMLGLDIRWCVTGPDWKRLTGRAFPEWMYEDNAWVGYREMFNLHAIENAGRQFGIVTGIKPPSYGRDGYTRFVPPDSEYDRAKVARSLANAGPSIPEGPHAGPPDQWLFPALNLLQARLSSMPPSLRALLFFVPYHRKLLPPPGTEAALVWDECKRRVTVMAGTTPNTALVDFMLPSPITNDDDNYWDPLHFRQDVADRLARNMAAAWRNELSPDYRILARSP